MGWSFFDRQRAAETFLATGSAAAKAAAEYTPRNPFDDFITPNNPDYRYGKCWENGNCAAGFYCVGGQCVQNTTAGNLGGTQNPGDCSDPVYDCGRNQGCEKPKCIETSVDDCCSDERCCRYRATGVNVPNSISVQCYCGPCEEDSLCNQWCDSYLKTIGNYLPGCNRDNTCTECDDCIGGAGPASCSPDTFNPPCHCDASICGECESCDSETGDCYNDAKKCKFCKNFFPKCPGDSGITGNAITICKSSPYFSNADIEYWYEKNCPSKEEACKVPGNSSVWCDDSQDPQPPCPPNNFCKDTGTISAGGATCYLRTDYDLADIPAGCSECENDSDCGDCGVCSLYQDPNIPDAIYKKCSEAQACADCTYDVRVEYTYEYRTSGTYVQPGCGFDCSPPGTIVTAVRNVVFGTTYELAKAYYLEFRELQRQPGGVANNCGPREGCAGTYVLPGSTYTSFDGLTQDYRVMNELLPNYNGTWYIYNGCYQTTPGFGGFPNNICILGGNPSIIIDVNCPSP